jgi:hypothetical protein
MDMLEFTYRPNGIEQEYQKILRRMSDLIRANGRDKESIEIIHKQMQDERNNLT